MRSEKERLSLVMARHGIEWEDKGTHDKHLSVLDYKKEQRAKEIAVLDTVKAEKESLVESQERRLNELAPAVKNMERLAADFSADPDEILPEPGTLETGRAYREKKAKPLLAQIVKVLRSLYLAYVELRGKFERLQGDYGRVRESNARLSGRLQEVKLENKACGKSPPTMSGSSGSLARNKWRWRYKRANSGNRRRKAESGPGVPLTGWNGKNGWTFLCTCGIFIRRNMKTAHIKSQS